eukprot:CAMPEP_0179478044 /NCGR_PEP_ID=MMETSP0799-20121207/56668_1 /TAXON_ID=46947 /ORGANISM="Geminigera cryophila, Strain CCMP2564" /LENGTH=177 /DNA_ID=CAMNT_0021289049 /DNA_START=259 /DNA_END=789 /DNA_ORIENTATION=-
MAEALHMQPSPTTWAMAYAHHAAVSCSCCCASCLSFAVVLILRMAVSVCEEAVLSTWSCCCVLNSNGSRCCGGSIVSSTPSSLTSFVSAVLAGNCVLAVNLPFVALAVTAGELFFFCASPPFNMGLELGAGTHRCAQKRRLGNNGLVCSVFSASSFSSSLMLTRTCSTLTTLRGDAS